MYAPGNCQRTGPSAGFLSIIAELRGAAKKPCGQRLYMTPVFHPRPASLEAQAGSGRRPKGPAQITRAGPQRQ